MNAAGRLEAGRRRGRETLNLNLTCSEGSAQEEEGDKGWGE